MLDKFIIVIISQYIHTENHYVIHQKYNVNPILSQLKKYLNKNEHH